MKKKFVCKTQEPDFIIIGAKKCATSAIYNYLNQHPQVLPCIRKEMHFFNADHRYEKGIEWYLSHFYPLRKNSRSGKNYLTGEASPGYLWSEQAALRLAEVFPKIKLIVSFRNPIDRAVSHYYHQVKTAQDETCSLEEALDLENRKYSPRYINPGIYIKALKKWMEIFPDPSSWYILRFEELQSDPVKVRKEVFEFLDLPDKAFIDFSNKVYSNKYPQVDSEIYDRLSEFYQPYNEELEEYLGMEFNWA